MTFYKSALLLALGTLALGASSSLAAQDGESLLSEQRLATVQELGRLTGVGLFCTYFDDAIPLKEVVIEVADKHKMDDVARAKLGNSYHSARDKAFNAGREGEYECPKHQQFKADALLARLKVSQAFD